MNTIFKSTLADLVVATPPPLIYHYTSHDGLLGVLRNKQVWATNIRFLNDASEGRHAVEYAQNAIENKINRGNLTAEKIAALEAMKKAAGTAAARHYTASFSEEGNLLSQWRAYCPPNGGYALGVPAGQLVAMAREQNFWLVPCIYDHKLKYKLISALIERHLEYFTSGQTSLSSPTNWWTDVGWQFAQDLAQTGCVFKHSSFSEEKEWRLISGVIDETKTQIDFRTSASRLVPYLKFNLVSDKNPFLAEHDGVKFQIMAGPTSDRDLASLATQFASTTLLPGSSFGVSEIPYRSGRN
ncbi:DUF2971 domain-containing protein [Massilia sp. UMI-21]|nr:DUF2971 domain-containing protein [Massilia sp. UMI-21]